MDLGESRAPFSFSDAALDEDRLYVLRQPYEPSPAVEPRVVAVDPRRWELVRTFGEDGVAPVTGLAGAPAAFGVDPSGGLVVAGAARLGPVAGGLRVLRLSAGGLVDAGFGDTLSRIDTGVPGAAQVEFDDRGRIVVLEASGSSLVRLTPAGRLDASFGRDGVVSLADVPVCKLPPARLAAACRTR